MELWLIQASASALLFSFAGVLFKTNSNLKIPAHSFFIMLYTAGTLITLPLMLRNGPVLITPELVLSGALVGAGMTLGNYLLSRSLSFGPISLSSPIINANVALLVVLAVFFYGESLTWLEGILVASLILSLLAMPIDPNEKKSIASRAWYPAVIGASVFLAIRNGGLKVTSEMALGTFEVLFWAYLTGALIVLVTSRISAAPHTPVPRRKKQMAWFYGVIGGAFSIAGMALYGEALATGPAAIVIPIFSAYNAFLVLWGVVFFGERLSRIQWVTLAVALVAVVILNF